MTLLFAFRWITRKWWCIFQVVCVSFSKVSSHISQAQSVYVCVCTAAPCSACVYILERVHVVRLYRTNMPPACWFLSALWRNETGCCAQSVWTDEITHKLHHKHTHPHPLSTEVCELWSWFHLVKMNEKLWRACLLIRIEWVILLAAFISIHCLNFQLVNWTGSRTKEWRCMGGTEQNTKIFRKLNGRFWFITSSGMGWALNSKLI